MDKQQFVDLFKVQFLASYAALKYDENCMRGWDNASHPVEDAEVLAEQVWEELAALKS